MVDELAQPSADPAAEAAAARDVAARTLATRGQRPDAFTQAVNQAPEPEPDYSVLPSDRSEIASGDVDLQERARLNFTNGFYRGTLAGSSRLALMASSYGKVPETAGPDETKLRKNLDKEYDGIVADLARYDTMRPWGTSMEAAVALGGGLAGGMLSPESFLGASAKGVTALGRTIKSAFQQGAIQAATDPIVQFLNNQGGTEHGYSPMQTAVSFGMGAIVGGGIHGIGELVSATALRKIRTDLAKEDGAFAGDLERVFEANEKATGGPPPDLLPSEIEAWHGSPHDFDKFDMSKVGTGEGAQSYGHGLYFAENPEVAESYKQQLSLTRFNYDGRRVEGAEANAADILSVNDGDKTKALEQLKEIRRSSGADQKYLDETEAAIGRFDPKLIEAVPDPTTMYKVRLRADRDKLLDWDKPLAEQSQGVLDTLAKLVGVTPDKLKASPMKIGDWLDAAGGGSHGFAWSTPKEMSDALREAGIPGIKYLDQWSRPRLDKLKSARESVTHWEQLVANSDDSNRAYRQGLLDDARAELAKLEATPETPTSNFVIFDDKLVDITHKNGEALKPKERADAVAAMMAPPRKASSGDVLSAMPEGATDEAQNLAARQSGGALPMERARPQQGVTAPSATTGTAVANVPQAGAAQDIAIRSLQQQATDLAEAIGFPLRQGRLKNKKALGEFAPGTGVVRVREVPDFEVVAHEAGHAIEEKIGTDLTNLTQQFGSELAPLVSNPAAYKPSQHVQEGFAEYIRRYIGNPAHAQQVAPGFTTAFRNFMEKNSPDMLKAIDAAAESYQAYLRAPSVDVVASVVRSMTDDPDGWRGVVKDIRERGLPATVGTMVQNSYTKVLDDKAPIARAVRELAQAIRDQDPTHALVSLKSAENPDTLLRLAARSQQAAIRDMMDGTYGYHSTTPAGPSLTDALAKATGSPTKFGKWDEIARADFSTYLIARRAEYLWRKFEAGDLANPPAAFSRADANVAIAEFERLHPTFRDASDMVHGYTRIQLDKMLDAGLIDADLHGRLMKDEFYVPFMRDLSDKPLAAEKPGSSPEGPGMTSLVKKMKGSSRDIIDPIESIMMQTFLVNRTIQHNDVIRSFVKLAERAGSEGGRYVEKLPAHESKKYTFDLGQAIERKAREKGMPPDDARVLASSMADLFGEDPLVGSFFRQEPAGKRGEPIVFYKEGGELRAARFMSEEEGHALYETLTALPKQMTDAFSELVATTSSILRTGIISNPSFAVTNYIRDQVAAAILRSDYIPIISGAKGIAAEFRQSEAAKLYGIGGGVAPGSAIAPVERAIEADVNALAKKGYLVNRLTSFKGLLELASFTEAGTRNSVFGKVFESKKAQGLSDYEAMIEAAFQATDLLDFSRHGSRTLLIRNYIPFINAHFQGLDKAYRTMVQPIVDKIRGNQVFASDPEMLNNAVGAWVKAGGLGMILGAAWGAINHDSEAYRDASPTIKGTHVVVPFGNKMFLVPKPFELGIGFTAGEYAFQKWAQDDPRAAGQFVSAAWQALEPPNPLGDIPVLKSYFELKTNKSLFTGGDIVPDRLARLPAAQQYTDRTSSLAKFLGKQINVSPIKIDYAVGSVFGNWGRDIMTLSSGVDESAPAANWEDYVFLRRLIKDPTRTSDVTTKFWNFMARTTGTYNQNVEGYDNLVRVRDDAAAKDFLDKLAPRERAFVIMKSAADEAGKPAFKTDVKRLHPLQRAYDSVQQLNAIRRDLVDNNLTRWENNEPLKLNSASRRDLIENVRELAQMEMRNAFVIMKEPGYQNRPLFDTAPTLEKVRAIAPAVAEEIATRYATAKVYTTKAVSDAYPQFERALVRDGSEADLGGLAGDAQAEGYEFGGERAKRPIKRRIPIQPTLQ